MKILKLHEYPSGKEKWINIDRLICITMYYKNAGTEKEKEVTLLDVAGREFEVKETPEQIIGLIQPSDLVYEVTPLVEALEKTTDFIRTWADCLAGVQMSKESFIKNCGLIEAKAALSAYRGGE